MVQKYVAFQILKDVWHKSTVAYLEKHVPEVVFMQQPLWNFLGTRFVEAHVGGNRQNRNRNF
jgi:hypothetical protein